MIINQQIKIKVVFLAHNDRERTAHQITQHIHHSYALPFGTLPTATSYMLETLGKIEYTWKIFISEKPLKRKGDEND